MPTPTIPDGELFMNATLYTGNGSTQTIANGATGQSFQPDFVWIKERSSTSSHALTDSVRGVSNLLSSNTADAEATGQVALTSFNTNGFTVGNDGKTNESPQTYVGWQWKAGGTAVTNTAGSISAQVSANTTSGFSIVTFTGTGSNASIGHGLNSTPQFIIVKNRSISSSWECQHISLGAIANQDISLNSTEAAGSGGVERWWQLPTSSVFYVGTGSNTNGSGNSIVAYCWTPIAGYSAFGSYTGNGSTDGPFVYLGFRPRYVLTKRTDNLSNWVVNDTARSPFNITGANLYPNSSAAEESFTVGAPAFDFLSNGFKLRGSGSDTNGSGSTYIYMAFCENPLKYANAR